MCRRYNFEHICACHLPACYSLAVSGTTAIFTCQCSHGNPQPVPTRRQTCNQIGCYHAMPCHAKHLWGHLTLRGATYVLYRTIRTRSSRHTTRPASELEHTTPLPRITKHIPLCSDAEHDTHHSHAWLFTAGKLLWQLLAVLLAAPKSLNC
jgi:hypothetical protein